MIIGLRLLVVKLIVLYADDSVSCPCNIKRMLNRIDVDFIKFKDLEVTLIRDQTKPVLIAVLISLTRIKSFWVMHLWIGLILKKKC
jgi:hypothetical protein